MTQATTTTIETIQVLKSQVLFDIETAKRYKNEELENLLNEMLVKGYSVENVEWKKEPVRFELVNDTIDISDLQWSEIYEIETPSGSVTFPFDYDNKEYIFPSSEVIMNGEVSDIDCIYKGAIISIRKSSKVEESLYFETVKNF